MKKCNIKFVIVVKEGKVLVENKPVTFAVLDSIETVYVHANTKIQLIMLGSVIQFIKQIKSVFPSQGLL